MRDVSRPKAGFFSCTAGRFFVSKTGLIFELREDDDLDGAEEALVDVLPPDAVPMAVLFLLPSAVLRIAEHLDLDVPATLRAPGAADLLDELHWRGAGGWMPIAGLDLPALAALASHGLVDLAGEHARLGRAVQVLDGLTRALCDAPFAPPEAA